MSLRRLISLHRSAAAAGGAVLLAALTVSGTAAAPAALQSVTKPRLTVASTASLVTAGSALHVDVGYTCSAKSSTNLGVEAHQNLGDGFVANGFGYSRTAPLCDGKTHTMRLTVVPTGERGFRTGPVLVLGDASSCTPDGKTCLSVSMERSLTVR